MSSKENSTESCLTNVVQLTGDGSIDEVKAVFREFLGICVGMSLHGHLCLDRFSICICIIEMGVIYNGVDQNTLGQLDVALLCLMIVTPM